MADFPSNIRPLIISMGFNGYQWVYRRNITTHRAYAEKHGYDYVFIDKPAFTPLLMECTWLKIPLLMVALQKDYPWVLYIDSDMEIKPHTPPIETLLTDGKSIYMANGFSGRPNAGLILVKQSRSVYHLLEKILASALKPLPPEDDVGWGDNGHVIHFVKHFPELEILPTEWNNNQDPTLDDYISHYSAGPMRQHYKLTPLEKAAATTGKIYLKIMRKIARTETGNFFSRLTQMTASAQRDYSSLSGPLLDLTALPTGVQTDTKIDTSGTGGPSLAAPA